MRVGWVYADVLVKARHMTANLAEIVKRSEVYGESAGRARANASLYPDLVIFY